jgi:GNAT superfamily N-acetyltransferase
MVSGFRPRDARIFRPYPDEIPWELLPDDAAKVGYPDDARMRIAKLGAEVIGVYVIEPVNELCYRVLELAVAPGYRSHGLGRWLLGHAIGLAESKGAREILVRGQSRRRFFAGIGFVEDGADLKLVLTPE